MTTRKTYTKEFKLDAVRLVTEQGYARAEAARNLGINANMPGRWVQEHLADKGAAFRGKGKLKPEQQELRRLQEENRKLSVAVGRREAAIQGWRNPQVALVMGVVDPMD